MEISYRRRQSSSMLEQRLNRAVSRTLDCEHAVPRVDFFRSEAATIVEFASDEDGGVPSG